MLVLHLLFLRETLHLLSPCVSQHCLRVILRLPPSLVSSQIGLAVSLCYRELQTAGNWHVDGWMEKTLGFFSVFSNFIPSNLRLVPTPAPLPPLQLSIPLSVPLNLYFVFCCSSDHRRWSSLSPVLSLRAIHLPPFIPLTLPLTCLHSFFHAPSVSVAYIIPPFASVTDRSQEKCSKVPHLHKDEGIAP